VYQSDPTAAGAEVQFDVAFGQYGGLPSPGLATTYESIYTPADAVYRQYANILLPKGTDEFVFADGITSGSISVINFKRDKLKEGLEAGHWELSINNGTLTYSLIDESLQDTFTTVDVGPGVGKAYYVISGSGTTRKDSTALASPYGIAYPDLGILVLSNETIN